MPSSRWPAALGIGLLEPRHRLVERAPGVDLLLELAEEVGVGGRLLESGLSDRLQDVPGVVRGVPELLGPAAATARRTYGSTTSAGRGRARCRPLSSAGHGGKRIAGLGRHASTSSASSFVSGHRPAVSDSVSCHQSNGFLGRTYAILRPSSRRVGDVVRGAAQVPRLARGLARVLTQKHIPGAGCVGGADRREGARSGRCAAAGRPSGIACSSRCWSPGTECWDRRLLRLPSGDPGVVELTLALEDGAERSWCAPGGSSA